MPLRHKHKFDCRSKNYSEYDSERVIMGRDGKPRFRRRVDSTRLIVVSGAVRLRRSPELSDKLMSRRLPRQFESIFWKVLISISDTRRCPLPPPRVR